MSIGRYKGIDYKKQRICEVLAVDTKAKWWFTYVDGEPTGDHFRTLTELKQAVDEGHFDCADSPDGRHSFTPDIEYDPYDPPINCEHCGEYPRCATN
jgi:hypothetical protein